MEQATYKSPIAIHPGSTVKDELEYLGLAQSELSIRAGLSEKLISEIFNEKAPITPDTALKFERVLGLSADGLINMQYKYDLDLHRIAQEEQMNSELECLSRFSCYNEISKLGYVAITRKKVERVRELLRFFSVDSLQYIKVAAPMAFRQSAAKKINPESVAAWLRIGEIDSQKVQVKEYNSNKLKELIPEMRALTFQPAEKFSKRLQELCAECGIILIYTPSLKNTCINGVSRWLTPKKALIQLSLRNGYADIFWFTFFHEVAHILKHSKKETFIDYEGELETSDMELEADKFAQKTLIPSNAEFNRLRTRISLANQGLLISAHAKEWNISEGIIAGRLARETGDWQRFAKYRTRLKFVDQKAS